MMIIMWDTSRKRGIKKVGFSSLSAIPYIGKDTLRVKNINTWSHCLVRRPHLKIIKSSATNREWFAKSVSLVTGECIINEVIIIILIIVSICGFYIIQTMLKTKSNNNLKQSLARHLSPMCCIQTEFVSAMTPTLYRLLNAFIAISSNPSMEACYRKLLNCLL